MNSLGIYSAPYPSTTLAASAVNGQTLYVRAAVSDPFGSYDVNQLVLTITDPSAGVTTVTLTSGQVVADTGCVRTYEFPWLTGSLQGNYQIEATGHEGTEGITATCSTALYIANQDLGTPSTTEFTFGNNGYATNSYSAGSSICVQVTDYNRNTNATTVDTVIAVVTASTGDSEVITLTETGPNTGIFTGCLPSINSSSYTPSNGTLSVVPGATLTVTYTDPTNPADVSSANATIKPANAATPAVSVLKTLVVPANGQALVGSTVQFNLQVANSGTITVTNVTLTDTNLSTQYTFTGASLLPTSTNVSGNNVSLVWTNLGSLAVGASTNVSVFFKVLATGNLANSATVTGSATNGPSPAYVTGTQTGLTIAKSILTPVPGPAYIGNTVVFGITLKNTGTTTITTLPLEDSYSGGALQYVSASVTPSGAGGGQILWANLGPLAAGASTSVNVTYLAVGVSSPTVNSAAVNYGVDSNGNAVPAVSTSTNLTIVGGTIGTNVWFDANANGIYDAGDSPLAGVIVYLDLNNDGVRQATEPFATTDSSGNYLISSLAAGTYVVRVDTNSLPAGVKPTYDLDGTATPHVASVTLASGQNRTDANFGYTGTGSIGDYVWYDVNGDGLPQANEPPLSGVRVFIDANGNGAWDTNETYQFTTASGFYTFSNLVAGAYNIAVDYTTLPAGAVCTGDPDATKNGATTTMLAAGQNVTTDDFGFRGNASIAGSVLVDVNGNGVFDSQDTTGIPGVTVTLYTANGVPLATNLTSASGSYSFANLLPGNYVVVETDLPGSISTADTAPPNDNRIPLTLASGQASTGNNFLDTLPASITGSVKLDVNGNGVADPEDTKPIAPVVINVYTNGVTLVATVTNNSDGTFSITGLPPGSYTVVQTVPPGYVATTPATVALTLTSGSTGTAKYLDLVTFSLGNSVFADWNNNGSRDVGDGGISGVKMLLFTNSAGGPSGSVLQSTVTDTYGLYRFDGLLAGTYVVVVDKLNSSALNGFVSSTGWSANSVGDQFKDHGMDTPVTVAGGVINGIAGIPVTLGLGLQPTNEITGNQPGAGRNGPAGDLYDNLDMTFSFTPAIYSVGNRVFLDNGAGTGGVENDGIQESGEPGIYNVVVDLFAADSNGNPIGTLLQTQTTDANGYYRFDGLVTGTYVVVVDKLHSSALNGLVSSTGASADMTATGDLHDHGLDTPLGSGSVVPGGIVSTPVTVGAGLQPTGETDLGGGSPNPPRGNGPNGDADDNLVVDFGFAPAYSVGNLVFLDNGADGLGGANDGVLDHSESGIANISLNLYAADTSGNPAGAVLGTTATDNNGYYRFDGIPAGSYVVVVNVLGSGSALNGLQSSAVVSSDNTLTGDNHNHGKNTPLGSTSVLPGGIASDAFTLGAGLQPTGEATGSGAGAHGPNGDASDNLVIDFGFAPNSAFYSIGNRVFRDDGSGGGVANNGIQDGSEPGIAGVVLKVFAADASGNPTGSALDSQTTDDYGYYRFDDRPPGTYVVVVDVLGSSSALSGLQSSHGASTDFSLTGDLKDHGKDTPLGSGSVLPGGIASAAFTLGPGLQPLLEATYGTGAGAHGPDGDANDNLVVDFGFAPSADFFSIGHRVFNDNGVGHGVENNGLQDGTEAGISNVVMDLFLANNGAPSGAILATTTTDTSGYYRFDGVGPGTYVVVVDVTNSPTLTGYVSSTGYINTTTTDGQYYDHGKDTPVTVTGAVTNGIASVPVTVGVGLQPTGEAASGSGAGLNGPTGDANDNLTINFGFTPTYSIGNKVYEDPDDDGTPDEDSPDEPGWPNVHLYVFSSDSAGNIINSTPLATTTTDASGYYRFDGLVAGTYVVVVDQANSPSLSLAHLDDPSFPTLGDYYNKGIGHVTVGSIVNGAVSAPVTLGYGLQPLGEALSPGQGGNGPLGDAYDNLTVDIGFYPLYSIGNCVFLDLNNNGYQDSGEAGIPDVVVDLFKADSSGAPTGAMLATTNTDSLGYYRFDYLLAGAYVVIVDKAHSPNLSGLVSSTGASRDTSSAGDRYDHGLDTPLGSGSVVPGGIVSTPLLIGSGVFWPSGEYVEGTGAGAHGPNGDIADYLIMDFGFIPSYSLGNRVFLDANNNGYQDTGEPGLANVALQLFAADGSGNPTGSALATTNTDANGYYRFDGVRPGTYVVVVDKVNSSALNGFLSSAGVSSDMTLAGDGHDHGQDTPVSVGTVVNGIASTPVTVGPNLQPTGEATGAGAGANGPNGDASDNLVVDFGFAPTASVAGRVLVDVNGNGVADAEDTTGIRGVTVVLQTASGATVATRVTSADGSYLFTDVAPGQYTVTHTVPSGYSATTPASATVTLTSGSQGAANFLDTQPAQITGSVKLDVNGNGVADPEDTGAIASVTIKVYMNGTLIATLTSGSDGTFNLTGLSPGQYTVTQTVPSGYIATTPASATVTLTSGSQGAANFLDTQPATIAGSVLVDVNGNGVLDAEDTTGISGVTVVLLTTNGVPVATNLTSVTGTYGFTNIPPGAYVVAETNLSGWISTGDSAPPNDDQIPVTLLSGQTSIDNNFLDTQPGSIAGKVLVDVNGNGAVDPEDTTGLSGVTIALTTNGVAVATSVTSADGSYLFPDVPPGNYVVVKTDPPGWVGTGDSAPPNDNQIPVALTTGQASTGNTFVDTPTFSISSAVGTLNTGPETLGPGGSYTWAINDATGTAGSPTDGWDLVNVTGDLDILSSSENPFAINVVSLAGTTPGNAANFNCQTLYQWPIITVSGSILNFAASDFTINAGQFQNFTGGGAFTLQPSADGKSLDLEFTPHVCAKEDSQATPPWYLQDSSDPTSPIIITYTNQYGLSSVIATKLVNCTMTYMAYDVNGNAIASGSLDSLITATTLPAGTVEVVCTATLIPPNSTGACNAKAMDMCGSFGITADPVTTELRIGGGGQAQLLFTNIAAAERLVSVLNGTPGLTNLTIVVNGHSYVLAPLGDGAAKSLDVTAAMLPGDANIVLVVGQGVVGASAAIALGDAPAGDPTFVTQPVALQVQNSAQGVQLSWPATAAGYGLQSRPSLAAADPWVNWPAAPQSVNGRCVVTVPAGGSAQFFRLSKP